MAQVKNALGTIAAISTAADCAGGKAGDPFGPPAQVTSLHHSLSVASGASPCHLFPYLRENLGEAVGRRGLQRRERTIGLEFLQPQRLADRNDVPVVDISGVRSGKCAALAHEA